MKENAISKINTLGKAGYIIATICKILAIVCIVAILLSAVVMFILPKDVFTFSVGAETSFNFDINSFVNIFDEEITEENIAQVNEAIQNETFRGSINDEAVKRIELTEDGLIIETGEIPVNINTTRIGGVLIVALIHLVMTVVCIQLLCMLCKELQTCRTPYEPGIIRRLEQLAVSVIPWIVFMSLSSGISNGILTGQYDIVFDINLEIVLLVIMLFIVVYIFKYGAVLQQESDETL